jgi:hypothetical protein
MHNTPIGPTGAAIEKPMAIPLRKKQYPLALPTGSTKGGKVELKSKSNALAFVNN